MKKVISFLILMVSLPFFNGCGDNRKSAGVDDPYLWLEDIEGERSLTWVKEQNSISEKAFETQPVFTKLKDRFLEVFNDKDRLIYPGMTGNMVYDVWQDETNERGLWRRMKKDDFLSASDKWETVIDLDKLSAQENRKWVFHGADWLAPDNRICLLNLSDGGKDESVIREFDAVSKKFIDGGFTIPESKSSSAWVDKDHILVATDYGEGTMTTSGYASQVKLWTRGTDLSDAQLITSIDTTWMGVFTGSSYSGGKSYVFVDVKKSFYDTESYLFIDGKLVKLDIQPDAEVYGLHNDELLIYLQSDWNVGESLYTAGSLVSFNVTDFLKGGVNVKQIYKPDEKASFSSLMSTSGYVVVSTMENVQSRLKIYRLEEGKWIEEAVTVPEFGTISLVSSDNECDDYFFAFSNPIIPNTLYHGNGGKITELKSQKAYFDASDITVNQYEAISKDGTVIPYFIVHPREMIADGMNPTLIYGYGGFNISEQPAYSAVRGIGWMESGGVYVIANIRGGGEFGPSWHHSAMKEKRQNAYDDFFAVAEDLIKKNITSPKYMAAFGWSNGGLLAGVALTQRPDLYSAVVIGAPLLDMKRYSKLLAGASWMGEYGDPDKPDDWEYLRKFSPYQNVDKNTQYPEALFITSTKDDRVHPGHARKMAAKMLDMGHHVYYHETIEGGHGAASTNAQEADMWALMYTYLNMKLRE